MRYIIVKIKLHVPDKTPILLRLSECIERFLKRQGVPFEKVDCYVKLDENE